jgi:hypothetical protein
MEDHMHSHAMAEVAFALAMAFFSIMVLAMVSMGIPHEKSKAIAGVQKDVREQPQLALFENREVKQDPAVDATKTKVLVYFNGEFYNENLNELNVQTLEPDGVFILAVSPKLSVDEAMSVKATILSPDVSISLLDDRWLKRLEAGS